MEWIIWIVIQCGVMLLMSWFIFNRQRKALESPKKPVKKENCNKELAELKSSRSRSLSVPLTELSRPMRLDDIVGQREGIRALRAAICGPNPQHVLIYGPPGVGKTCAARLVLEEAKHSECSPFNEHSQFIEVDATCVRFDERAIADPLMGSVHDPIYQGAGSWGSLGVPQPKPGAVSRAHCGILFLDEIGELHPLQLNKLLKVLEDRRVFFDSAYYTPDNTNIPPHIHDIFQNGLPADFRLVGATTRAPEEIPAALRSRCVELYFRALSNQELEHIVHGASIRMGYDIDDEAVSCCAGYSSSGREAVNMRQLAGGSAYMDGRSKITQSDIKWVAQTCRYSWHTAGHIPETSPIGTAYGMGVSADLTHGFVMEIECSATPVEKGMGRVEIIGMAEEEEIDLRTRKLRRKSTVRASVENVISTFLKRLGSDCRNFDIRFNIPGGMPVDGPSAGIAFAVALMSALTNRPAVPKLVLTGEITMNGEVRPVGGVQAKVEAAEESGARIIIVPQDNLDETLEKKSCVRPVSDISEVMRAAFGMDIHALRQYKEDGIAHTA